MKSLYLSIFLLITMTTFSQKANNAQEIVEIEMNLLGYWESSLENQDEMKYCVEKQNGQLFLNIGKFQKGGLEFIVKDKILMEIIDGKTILLINFVLQNEGVSELQFLDSEKLILKNGHNSFEFKKLK